MKVKRVRLPVRKDLWEHHQLIREKLIPAAKQLEKAGFIKCWYLMVHGEIEYDFIPDDSWDDDAAREILLKSDVPASFDPGANPAETALQAAATRALEVVLTEAQAGSTGPDAARNLKYLVHYLLNQFGFGNCAESEWHTRQATLWAEVASTGGA